MVRPILAVATFHRASARSCGVVSACSGRDTATVLTAGAVLGVEFDERRAARAGRARRVDGRPCAGRCDRIRLVARGRTGDEGDALRDTSGRRRAVLRSSSRCSADECMRGPPACWTTGSGRSRRRRRSCQLARHCALGDLLPDAMRWAAVAGDHALAHLAPSEAATWYRAALEPLRRPRAPRRGACRTRRSPGDRAASRRRSRARTPP